ncbi:2-octaprenyl-6-methoxyphenyl hydroxylase [Ectothiorhodospira lacustris]|uniref:2-octaprenyl-6-methoxyphenyl hydroxylase n=1 Tax=Ectothiorhodospira lacustris TaxID=2899127 RepID=UPI001EE9A0F7|nr:2-octaprenyl-6-methoxyphenyl hydroxylase [Ectothiorhodospira lacustris]MCG5508887.1 2-octaprenyl-6-methoxyphenyl hydroxylase [Ectothiorhodospira lacustris]MCG5520678.1 2-octaprenyl-6-methoxyphenyl hydroxylase [Ectothiorhodospira lacustris]
MQNSDFDILIAGGGMVGATLGLGLADSGYRVGIIEAQPPGVPGQPSYDERATALSWSSRCILERLGLWAELAPHAAPIGHIHVSQMGYFGSVRLDHREEGVEALGYVIVNRVLGQVLQTALAAAPVTLMTPARVTGYTSHDDHLAVQVSLDQVATPIRTRLLVGADGTRSVVRNLAGIDIHESDYGQAGIIANLSTELDHQGKAFERFTDEGPVALLPLSPAEDGSPRCALVWVRPAHRLDETLAWDDGHFLQVLQDRFGHRLGRLRRVGARVAYPLTRVRAVRDTDARLVLVGNASHTIHPVAGQGFNLALRDVDTLADLLCRAGREASDPGDAGLLQCYADRRRPDLDRVTGVTDALARLFTTPGLGHLRGAALAALNLCGPLRHGVARAGMGL